MKTIQTDIRHKPKLVGSRIAILHSELGQGYATVKDIIDAYTEFSKFVVDQKNAELYKDWMLYTPANFAKVWTHLNDQARLVVIILALNAHYYRGRTD